MATYYSLDGAGAVQGTGVSVSAVGTHTLDFWSTDPNLNVEAAHEVTFAVSPAVKVVQTLTRPSAPSSVRHKKAFTITGYLKPRSLQGRPSS